MGDAETVAGKIVYVNEVLGGLSRITFQVRVSALPQLKMLRSMEVPRVTPMVRKRAIARASSTYLSNHLRVLSILVSAEDDLPHETSCKIRTRRVVGRSR